MVASLTGSFAHFDLADAEDCGWLAVCIKLSLQKKHDKIRARTEKGHLSEQKYATAENIVSITQVNPLLKDIITAYVNAISDFSENEPWKNPGFARQMELYAVPEALDPQNTEAYEAAKIAWKNKVPLRGGDAPAEPRYPALSSRRSGNGAHSTRPATYAKKSIKSTKSTPTSQSRQSKDQPASRKAKVPKAASASYRTYHTSTHVARVSMQLQLPGYTRSLRAIFADTYPGLLGDLSRSAPENVRTSEAPLPQVNGPAPSRKSSPNGDNAHAVSLDQRASQIEQDAQIARSLQTNMSQSTVVKSDGSSEPAPGDLIDEDTIVVDVPEDMTKKGTRPRAVRRSSRPEGVRLILKDVDFRSAKVHQVDPSKLHITIPAEIPDPKVPGQYIPYPPFEYRYKDNDHKRLAAFDWSDKKQVTQLSSWRHQTRYRNVPPTRKERFYWLEIEKAKITHMIRLQLENSIVVKWNRLANEFNRDNLGRMRRVGEKILWPGVKQFGQLHEDFPAAWRKASSIWTVVSKWTEAKKLVDSSRYPSTNADDSSSDDDEDEDEEDIDDGTTNHGSRGRRASTYTNASYPSLASRSSASKHKREISYTHASDSESSDDEEIPDPSPQPSDGIEKAKRYASIGPKLDAESQFDSQDDEESLEPSVEPESEPEPARRMSSPSNVKIRMYVAALDKTRKGKATMSENSEEIPRVAGKKRKRVESEEEGDRVKNDSWLSDSLNEDVKVIEGTAL